MSRLARFFYSLVSELRRWASPIDSDDTVKARTGTMISTLLLITAGLWTSIVILMALLNIGNRANIVLALAASGLLLVVRELVRRGRITLATILGIAAAWGVFTAFHYNLGTPYSVHSFGYLLLVIVAAWLSGWGGGLAAVLLSAASVYVLARARTEGLLPQAVRMEPLNLALNAAGYLGGAFALFWLARSNSLAAMGEAYGEIARRQEAEAALRDLNATLEQQVSERTEALRASEERYRTLLALSPDGIVVMDDAGHILLCNEQLAHVCGRERADDLRGQHATEFLAPGMYESLFSGAAALLEGGHDVVRDLGGAVIGRDGARVDVEFNIARVPWSGAPQGDAFICVARDVTRRKRLQAELELYRDNLEAMVRKRTTELEQTAHSLAEAERIAHVGSWEWDLRTGERHWSDEIRSIFGVGFDDPEMIRANIWQAVYEEDCDAVEAAYSRALATGETFDMIYRVVRPSGEIRTVRGRAEFKQDSAGQTIRVQGMVQDVTEQERARAALSRRVEELTRLQELGHLVRLDLPLEEVAGIYLDRIIGFAEVDLAQVSLLRDGELHAAAIRTSPKLPAAQTSTLTVGECLCGCAARDGAPLFVQETDGDLRCTQGHCRANGVHSVAALPLKIGDASIGVLTLGASAPQAFAGRDEFLAVVGNLLAIRLHNALLHGEIQQRADGLEESVAERTRELQAERDRTHAILETVGESVVVTDLDGQVLFANPATSALTGFSRDELLGLPLWHNWTAQTLTNAWPDAEQALAAGQAWQGEVYGRRKDGALYIARLTGSPLYDAGAPRLPVGAVWVQRDITELKQAERLKDQFVSNVSHELRTPISIIGLCCDNLAAHGRQLSEDQRWETFKDIHDQAHLLGRMVDDVLLLSRIDAGRVPQEHTQVDLAALLLEEVGRQQVFAKERSQRVAAAAPHPVLVEGNAMQLRQVVRNLLDNAIKYTQLGGQIRCACQVRSAAPAQAEDGAGADASKSWAVIEVADNGTGIAPEEISAIFERFYRGQVEGDVPGTGLGLSIVRELTQLHGGWIDVVSAPGAGSTFTVYLPLIEEGRVEG